MSTHSARSSKMIMFAACVSLSVERELVDRVVKDGCYSG